MGSLFPVYKEIVMGLLVPLTQIQIDAACRLHQRLDQWWLSDTALKRLRETFPSFDRESCLIKSVVINTLYGTQVLAIVRMAQHVETVLRESDIKTAKIDLEKGVGVRLLTLAYLDN
jgi:hypothetical protein